MRLAGSSGRRQVAAGENPVQVAVHFAGLTGRILVVAVPVRLDGCGQSGDLDFSLSRLEVNLANSADFATSHAQNRNDQAGGIC